MNTPQLWFSRTFNFPYPAELLPNLLSRLRGTPSRLKVAFCDVSAEVCTAKPAGKWSAQEHAGHLLDLETLWRIRLDDFFSSSAQQLTPADLTNRATDEGNFNARPLESILASFGTARTALLAEVATRDIAQGSRTLTHPRLKAPMRDRPSLFRRRTRRPSSCGNRAAACGTEIARAFTAAAERPNVRGSSKSPLLCREAGRER